MSTKKCYTCQKTKSLGKFNKNKSRVDGLNSICRPCSNLRSRQYYKENRKKHIEDTTKLKKKYQQRNREFVYQYLIDNPCIDCGETMPVLLEFDHKRDKTDNISNMIHAPASISALEKEIAKCNVRCVKCHRLKTASDQNWWKLAGP